MKNTNESQIEVQMRVSNIDPVVRISYDTSFILISFYLYETMLKKKKTRQMLLNFVLLIFLLFGDSMYMILKSKFIVCSFPV